MSKVTAFALPLIAMVILNILGQCEMSVYPGLRRKPVPQNFDVSSDFWAPLMEENARRRLQQQFEQQLELINMQMSRQRQRQAQLREKYRQQQLQQQLQLQRQRNEENEENDVDGNNENEDEMMEYKNNNNNNNINQYDQYDNVPLNNMEYSYKYPNMGIDHSQRIPFAVGPSDPRFYKQNEEIENRDNGDLDSGALDEYEEYVPAESIKHVHVSTASTDAKDALGKDIISETPVVLAPAPVETSKILDTSSTTFHRIKPQNAAAAAAVAGVNVVGTMKATSLPEVTATDTRHDITALINKLQKEGKSGVIINGHNEILAENQDHAVLRQHMGIDGEMGMYLVALIAGVSAAITVGLIALGIAWLHNRTKQAADVEYPAYGVTGPNKDISPSGDRKLAQSAQMYHYQHQKQQIIAMENRQAVEGSCGLSDVESDDDNEEGDYTVYECPGLAPTGEMEVKNPLFLDETPLTPAGNVAAAAVGGAQTTLATQPPANNITQATPQQPQTIRKNNNGKSSNAASATSSSSEEKRKKNKK